MRVSGAWILHRIFVVSSLSVSVGCVAADQDLSTPQPQINALTKDARPIDTPSSPAVALHWRGTQDGRAATQNLQLDIENTTDRAIDVSLYVTSRAGSHVAQLPPTLVRLAPRSTIGQSLAVDQLGVQLVGASATTQIAAVYMGPDGVQRAASLPAVWIEHDTGFTTAHVRSAVEEARSNAALGLVKLRSRRPSAARALDASTRAISQLSLPTDNSLSGGQLVMQPAELPTPAQVAAMRLPTAQLPMDGIADADRPASPTAPAGAFNKGINFTVCFRLPYWYADALYGEDFLIGETPTTEGSEPARYMLAALVNSANQIIWIGNLDPNGCTPAVNHPNGTYTGWVTTSIFRPYSGQGVLIDVTTDNTKTFSWGAQTYNINGSGFRTSLWFTGAWSVTDAAVAAANTLYRSTFAYPDGTSTSIYTDQDCPGFPASGCNAGTEIWLGTNLNMFPNAGFKYVTQHELGHRVQGAMMGIPNSDYTIDATQAACRCDHVTSTNNQHCLQGQARSWTAQAEGWGQFFATTNLNIGSQSNCTFVYYKEFRNDDGSVTNPPMGKSCFDQVRWMGNRCPAGNRGTEYDWMNHYWRISNKDAYTWTDFTNLYRTACGGGSCSGVQVTWYATAAAAVAAFGQNSVKANAWSVQSNNFGVNY